MMKKVSIFLGCACFLSLFILQPAYAQWSGFSNPYGFGTYNSYNYGYPYSGFTQPNYGYSWNQPYGYGWDQTSYGWNQPYSYGWGQPYSYGWNQPSYGWDNYNYMYPSNYNPYSYSYQNVSPYNRYMPYGDPSSYYNQQFSLPYQWRWSPNNSWEYAPAVQWGSYPIGTTTVPGGYFIPGQGIVQGIAY